MNRFSKTLLLLGLQKQCQTDRTRDWQSLHRRDRQWFLTQTEGTPWQIAQRWLQKFAQWPTIGFTPSALLVILIGALFGVGLMSGLLQFQPQQRINLWWWLLLCVWLPALWWLLGLWLSRSMSRNSLAGSLSARFLPKQIAAMDSPLLGMTSRALAQQFSLGFALGLLGTFMAYLVLTDLAFGWSSTLDLTDRGVLTFTQTLSLPWQGIWPAAVPSLELVEQTRFFRIDDPTTTQGNAAIQWWPFLLMNLLVYVLLPRLLSFVWAQWQLARAQQRLFTQDACIDGWWQRLHQELVRQQASPAPRNRKPDALDTIDTTSDPGNDSWPELQAIVTAGHWSAEQLATQIAQLPNAATRLPQFTEQQAVNASLSGQQLLLLCKGWEPPTSALADLCEQLHAQQVQTFLLPAPLPGMKPQRIEQLYESWRLFMPQLPPSCHLLELHQDV